MDHGPSTAPRAARARRRAVASLTRAVEADGDNADYHRARGVANTLAEQFPAAIADLERALRLQPADREARLWLQSALRMTNDRDPRRTGSCFVYGGDVPARYAEIVCNRMARALLAMGRPAEARREYQAVRSYLSSWPATAVERRALARGARDVS